MRYLIGGLILGFLTLLVLRVSIVRAATVLIIGALAIFVFAAIVETRQPPPPRADLPADQREKSEAAGRAAEALWRAIPLDRVAIAAPTLIKGDPAADGHPMDYAATIANDGDRPLDLLRIRVRLYDCPAKPPPDFIGCFILGDSTQGLPVAIAAHERRDIAARFTFTSLREGANQFAWRSEIVAVHAAP
jgi:hypothetical protein